jgi:hypothetical protein
MQRANTQNAMRAGSYSNMKIIGHLPYNFSHKLAINFCHVSLMYILIKKIVTTTVSDVATLRSERVGRILYTLVYCILGI